jgi:hypothetical protein
MRSCAHVLVCVLSLRRCVLREVAWIVWCYADVALECCAMRAKAYINPIGDIISVFDMIHTLEWVNGLPLKEDLTALPSMLSISFASCVSQVRCVSHTTQHHATPRNTTQHHASPRMTTHDHASHNTTQHCYRDSKENALNDL